MSGGFFSLASELLWWVCKLRSSPASGNAPLGNQGTREPTGCVISKATKAGHPGGLAVTGLGKECTLLPREGQSPSCWSFIFTDGHVQSSRIRWGRPAERQKAKTKASDPPPEENRPRGQPPDHQARRRSRKETLTQVAQNGRERVLGQHEEKKTQWMRTARKVQQRKPAPPMRKKPARIKKYQKNRDGF